MRSTSPRIKALHGVTARAFAYLVANPERWVSVTELVEQTGISKATAYRRFANLAAAKVVQCRRENDHRHYRLRKHWDDSELARRLVALAAQLPEASAQAPR